LARPVKNQARENTVSAAMEDVDNIHAEISMTVCVEYEKKTRVFPSP